VGGRGLTRYSMCKANLPIMMMNMKGGGAKEKSRAKQENKIENFVQMNIGE
jgi:hypothetical protein